MNELALFAGAGGGILGGVLSGWRTVAAVEIEEYPRAVLLRRQADGILPRFPVWDDVRTFDGTPWRGRVDVISGGFPCQDISAAGKGAGINGKRSGLWSEFARIIGEVRPRYVLVENSPMLVGRGLTRVLGDLAALGFDTRWGVIGAHHAGAPHKRDRIWIVAEQREFLPHAELHGVRRWEQQSEGDQEKNRNVANADGINRRPGTERKDRAQAGDGCSDVADAESARLERHRIEPGESEITEPRNDGASVANADSLRESQSQRVEQNERRWSGDCGETILHLPDSGYNRDVERFRKL